MGQIRLRREEYCRERRMLPGIAHLRFWRRATLTEGAEDQQDSGEPEVRKLTLRPAMPFNEQIDSYLARRKTWIVAICCFLGAVRVLVYAAAFPLFNPVDETSHYQMVREYSRGHLPGSDLLKIDSEAADFFTLYSSSEYFKSREVLREFHRDVPIAALPAELRDRHYPKVFSYFLGQCNIETQSPPAYYLLAGAWYRLAKMSGAPEWRAAYWARFLNAILYGTFIWVACLFVKEVYPERVFFCVGMAMLLAVFPQDVFYGMSRDVLLPLVTSLFLLFLLRGLRTVDSGECELLAAGFLAGIAFLTELSSVVLFGALLAVTLFKSKRAEKLANSVRQQTMLALSLVAAAILPLTWMVRNRLVMGDLTGTQAKLFCLGWVTKPWGEIWQHPIFSFRGVQYFVHELTASYWRGEIIWAGQPLRNGKAEVFYLSSTLVLLAAFLVCFALRKKEQIQRFSEYLSLYLVAASVLFLASVSLLFDYQECVYPSRAHPYFVSGRIIIGTLLPFLVMYLSGFEFLLRPIRKYVHPILPLLVICASIACAEATLMLTVFHSHFNFYALWKI